MRILLELDAISLNGVRFAGIMHSKVDNIAPTIDLLKRRWPGPLMAYPDSGYFKMPHRQFVDIISVLIYFNKTALAVRRFEVTYLNACASSPIGGIFLANLLAFVYFIIAFPIKRKLGYVSAHA